MLVLQTNHSLLSAASLSGFTEDKKKKHLCVPIPENESSTNISHFLQLKGKPTYFPGTNNASKSIPAYRYKTRLHFGH